MGWLVAGFYLLFTLLPDSSTKVVAWPWVFLWQVALLSPLLWGLSQLWQKREWRWLGHGFDWLIGLTAIVLVTATLGAEFPHQARWYAWAALCLITAIYALNFWVQSAQQRLWLLLGQAYLGLAFIIVSLLLWTVQTFLPELSRLQELARLSGATMPFSFYMAETRNWAPIGHANYVAGYLVLLLPLLAGLCLLQRGWQRYLWAVGLGLGCLDLYTTNSRGGLLGAVVAIPLGFTLLGLTGSLGRRSWFWLVGFLSLATVAGLSNIRLRSQLLALANGQIKGDFYREVTTTVGRQMGLQHPWLGSGPGSVPLLFQNYRPAWAGREVELTFQLHNTPVQIWAELGIGGIIVLVATTGLLAYWGGRWFWQLARQQGSAPESDRILVPMLYTSLAAYGLFSLTDYQLDNLCISGLLIIFGVVLVSTFREPILPSSPEAIPASGRQPYCQTLSPRTTQVMTASSLGLLLVVGLWLVPIHWGWNRSNQGFLALSQKNIPGFVQLLTQAHRLVPWEPYYPLQLGWNLGHLSLSLSEPQQRQRLQADSATWLQEGNRISPYQEFGHTNLGWLLLNQNPQAAIEAFRQSAQLVPAKRGTFFGLGLSLLAQQKVEPAIEAMILETLRDPLLITSPIWQSAPLQSLYSRVLDGLEQRYTQLLQTQSTQEPLTTLFHQSRGGLRWWRGDLAGASRDLAKYGNDLSRLLLDVSLGKSVTATLSQLLPPDRPLLRRVTSGWALVVAAWFNPTQRAQLLQQGWILVTETPLTPELQDTFLSSMAQSNAFDQWLRQNAPIQQYRRERPGFGPLNRHIDGPAPIDFLSVAENIPMTRIFAGMLPSPVYLQELDQVLQPWREQFLNSLS